MTAEFCVADLGNSRLKWGWVDQSACLKRSISLPLNDESAWDATWADWGLGRQDPPFWAVATVNPPMAERLGHFLRGRGVDRIR